MVASLRVATAGLVLVAGISGSACLPGLASATPKQPAPWPSEVTLRYDARADATTYTTRPVYLRLDWTGMEDDKEHVEGSRIVARASVTCPGRGVPCGASSVALDVDVHAVDPATYDTTPRLLAGGQPIDTRYVESQCGTICGHASLPLYLDLFRVALTPADFQRVARAERLHGHIGATEVLARPGGSWRALADSLQRWAQTDGARPAD